MAIALSWVVSMDGIISMEYATVHSKQLYDEEWAENIWKEGWAYIKTVATAVLEPLLILDKNLCVLASNQAFCKLLHAKTTDIEYKHISNLGRKEWNIRALEALFQVIVPRNGFFSGFEVNHAFPSLGKRIMMLNNRSIYKEGKAVDIFPPIILLATADINEMTAIAEAIGYYAAEIEQYAMERTKNLEVQVEQLKKDVKTFKIDPKYLL
jgi:two-component system CheB/CheR fusion protein